MTGTTSFMLQGENNRVTTIALTGTTTISSGQTGAAATLAVGESVIVEGTFDPTTETIAATSVTLNDFTTINHAEAGGTVASVDTTAGTFVLTVLRAEGITPTGRTNRRSDQCQHALPDRPTPPGHDSGRHRQCESRG